MLEGLMQHDHPLTLQHVLKRMRTMNGHEEVVTLTEAEPERLTYAELGERVDRLCQALTTLGVKPGDRVATFSWNTQRHLEIYLAAPCMGAVLRHGGRAVPIVPMFHANAWGFPSGAGLIGASLTLPSRFVAPEPLARAIEAERVTIAAAVPTVWLDLLRYADENEADLSSLRTVPCGGAAVPESLMRAFEERHGVRIVQAWGMTETRPLAST